MKNFKLLLLVISGLLFITSCDKDDNEDPKSEEINLETKIIKPEGGAIETPEGIKLIFPSGAVTQDTEVSIGYVGNEPSDFVNPKLQMLRKAFTIKIAVDSLNQAAILEIPKPDGYTNTDETVILISNGSTYFPLHFTDSDSRLTAKLDYLNYEKIAQSASKKNTVLGTTIVIFVLKYMQTPPESEMGLKKVNLDDDNTLNFSEVPSLTRSDRVLIMVHGWVSNPSSPWTGFLEQIKPQIAISNYTHYLTFGYNSSLSISENGVILANLLSTKMNGAKVDIVAHSMGGLVSRSAIENQNSSSVVRSLITIGTPHKGSNAAVLRYFIGALIIQNPLSYYDYNINSQGFKDLNTFSNFLTQLNQNPAPATVYYPICAVKGFEDICLTDGVVKKSSALGIQNNDDYQIGSQFIMGNCIWPAFPHLRMTTDDNIVNDVAERLNSYNTQTTIPTDGLVAYYPFNGNANDESGNENHGVVNGATLTKDRYGNPNSAYHFGGLNNPSHIKINNAENLKFENELTISSFIKITDFNGMDGFGNPTAYGGHSFFAKSHDRTGFALLVGGSENSISSHIASYESWVRNKSISFTQDGDYLNEWFHISYVFSSNSVKIYFDGELVREQQTNPDFTIANSQDIYIGKFSDYWYPLNGDIDEIRIYNRVLTNVEILALSSE